MDSIRFPEALFTRVVPFVLAGLLTACGGSSSDEPSDQAMATANGAVASSVTSDKQAAPVSVQNPAAAGANEWASAAAVGCTAPDWVNGRSYAPGTLVRYAPNNRYYKALHANPGYNPTISTWYWAATTCTTTDPGTATPTPQGPVGTNPACNGADWAAGRYYTAGTTVRYAATGQYFSATHDNPGYNPTVSTWYWSVINCNQIHAPAGVLAFMITEAQFNNFFPLRNSFYTYSGFVNAAKTHPNMFRGATDALRKQEMAAFLANVRHESGDLVYIREINQAVWSNYCGASTLYPCAPSQQYYGRGPLQLSWNYNYGAAGKALSANLLQDPDLVARDPVIAWRAAMWFWMTQKGAGTMTMHDAIVNGAGFGETIRTLNGALECGKPAGSVGNGQMLTRVRYFQDFATKLGVATGTKLYC